MRVPDNTAQDGPEDTAPGAGLAEFVPESLRRPPRVFPAAPRVIYRTARDKLTHAGRIDRIDQRATLAAFRAFSHAFHAWRPRPEPPLRALLHNRGFLPDKGALYRLSDTASDAVLDSYLSDFMVAVLPMANGCCAIALRDRRLFWQLYRDILPLAPLEGLVQGGRVIRAPGGAARDGNRPDGPVLARPMIAAADAAGAEPGPGVFWLERLAAAPLDRGDLVVLGLPGGVPAAETEILRLAIIHDHKARRPVVLGAVLLRGDPAGVDRPGAQVLSFPVDPDTGIVGPGLAFARARARAPVPVADLAPDLNRPRILPGWRSLHTRIVSALLRLPIGVAIQLDILRTSGGPVVVDATDRLDAAGFQVHGPLLDSPAATAFVREYGL